MTIRFFEDFVLVAELEERGNLPFVCCFYYLQKRDLLHKWVLEEQTVTEISKSLFFLSLGIVLL